jgi:hypothetical protein
MPASDINDPLNEVQPSVDNDSINSEDSKDSEDSHDSDVPAAADTNSATGASTKAAKRLAPSPGLVTAGAQIPKSYGKCLPFKPESVGVGTLPTELGTLSGFSYRVQWLVRRD